MPNFGLNFGVVLYQEFSEKEIYWDGDYRVEKLCDYCLVSLDNGEELYFTMSENEQGIPCWTCRS